jgi:mono/diheme cytochrome c family protein
MRRAALLLVLLVAALGLVAEGCGGEESQTATPETIEGVVTTTESTTTETTTTETSGSTTTETQTTTTETGGALTGDPAAGKEFFLGSAACGGCHTLADAGSSGNVGPNLDDLKPTEEQVASQVTNGGGAMPAFKDTLTPQQIADVSAYVASVAGQ